MAKQIDYAKFNLEATRIRTGLAQDLAKTRMDIAERRVTLARKLIDNEKKRTELRQMKDALKEFERALKSRKKILRSIKKETELIEKKSKAAERLAWGELINPDLLTLGWAGLRFFLTHMQYVYVDSSEWTARHFSRPRYPGSTSLKLPPDGFNNNFTMIHFCRTRGAIPVVGSPPYNVLMETLKAIQGKTDVTEKLEALEEARKQLRRLRAISWKEAGIADLK